MTLELEEEDRNQGQKSGAIMAGWTEVDSLEEGWKFLRCSERLVCRRGRRGKQAGCQPLVSEGWGAPWTPSLHWRQVASESRGESQKEMLISVAFWGT